MRFNEVPSTYRDTGILSRVNADTSNGWIEVYNYRDGSEVLSATLLTPYEVLAVAEVYGYRDRDSHGSATWLDDNRKD